MNWKKLLVIAVVATGFAFVGAPRSEAGGVSVGIGIGVPVGYGYYGYAAPAYYPYGYGYSYPYVYGSAPYGYYRPRYVRTVVRPRYYWHHGRRVYHPVRAHRVRW